MHSNKRNWHGSHQLWSYRPEAFRWSGEMICGINLIPIATELRQWMTQQGLLSLMPTTEAPERGGFTNPYTNNGITLSLLMSSIINNTHEYVNTNQLTNDPIKTEIERLRLYNEVLIYSARFCEVAIKQLLYCTQIPESRYQRMALGQLLESPCPDCKQTNGKKAHLISLVATLAHPFHLCQKFEYCAMNHMDFVNKLRNSYAAHSGVQELNIRTVELSKAQLNDESLNVFNGFLHMLSHVEELEENMLNDLVIKAKEINKLKLNGLKAEDCNFNLVPGDKFVFKALQ